MPIQFAKELLLSVAKPARYIDAEIGAVKKDLSRVDVRVCLCFPDIYEIGMSHLGLRILYDLINKQPSCAAERVFSPWVDMEERLKENQIPLSSLESGVPVKDFDILGFSLQYELSFPNVLNILRLSGISLTSGERQAQDPLVIAGGTCCLNPEPMAEFIDAFVIGEAEEVICEIIEAVKRHKRQGSRGRRILLEALSLIEGVYVPSLTDTKAVSRIKKRYVKDLEKVLDLEHWVVPYIEIVHDRIGIEIMRGCPHACRFCQARSSFYPLRVVSEKKIVETCRRLCRKTGYEEISLLSLSSSDHPALKEIVLQLAREFKGKGVSISLPSVKARYLVGELAEVFSTLKKTSLTFAPEAASVRLRGVINKEVDIAELMAVARRAFQSGYRLLKLYFMIGLPTETDEDLQEIGELCLTLSRLKQEVDGRPAHLNVSISNFVPKPHTPFQWEAMASVEGILEKQEKLRKIFRRSRGLAHLKFHDARMSFIEALLSRGDRRLCRVIRDVAQAGARFDAWGNLFDFSLWRDALAKNAIDPQEYLCARDHQDRLAWDFIDMGFPKENLIKEASRAKNG